MQTYYLKAVDVRRSNSDVHSKHTTSCKPGFAKGASQDAVYIAGTSSASAHRNLRRFGLFVKRILIEEEFHSNVFGRTVSKMRKHNCTLPA